MNVLVVAAHPDDEILGCGATIARHADAGDAVHIVLLGGGIDSRGSDPAARAALHEAARRAAAIVGARSIEIGSFPDNAMDTVATLTLARSVETAIATVVPSVVYTHFAGDMNVDHQRVHDAVAVACRPQPRHPVETLLFFEVASSTEWRPPGSAAPFAPTWFVDAGATLERKLRALEAYGSEMRAFPHARSIAAVEHLARWRGASVGYEAAEAYVTGRHRVG